MWFLIYVDDLMIYEPLRNVLNESFVLFIISEIIIIYIYIYIW